MFTYPLKQRKQKHKRFLPKFPVLHVYIPSTKTQTKTQKLITTITRLTYVHNLYNKTNIRIKDFYRNSQSYMFIEPIQQHKNKLKGLLPKLKILHITITFATTKI